MQAFRNTRHDLIAIQDSPDSLARGRTCNVAITASGEVLYRGSEVFEFAPAIHIHSSNSATNLLCYASRSEMDEWLDLLVAHGFAGIGLMAFDSALNPVGGRPLTMWTDTVATAYNPDFYTGAAGAAGWDYFHAACSARGLYVSWRLGHAATVFLNRGVSAPSGNTVFQGMWDYDGTGGGPDLEQYLLDHILGMLNRTNTVNGKSYTGNNGDYVLWMINPINEFGHMKHWSGTSSTSSPSSNTFDKLCQTGNASASHLIPLYVAWRDSHFVSWHTAKYGSGPTWNGVAITTMPCRRYTGLMGSNIAARTYENEGTMTVTEQKRIERYWYEAERDWHQRVKAAIRAVAPHVRYLGGQANYIGEGANEVSDFVDQHHYHGILGYTANEQSIATASASYAAGTLTMTSVTNDSDHLLTVGSAVTVTVASWGGWSQVVTIATSGASTFTASIAPPGFTGPSTATVVLHGSGSPECYLHAEPPGSNVASSTSVQVNINGTAQEVLVSSMKGQNNYGYLEQLRTFCTSEKPGGCTELGKRGQGVTEDSHFLTFWLLSKLQGRPHIWMFGLVYPDLVRGIDGNHPLQAFASSLLVGEAIALLSRYGRVPELPNTKVTEASLDDLDDYMRQYSGTIGWANLTTGAGSGNTVYHAFFQYKLRHRVGSSAKTAETVTAPTASGAYLNGLSNTSTGAVWYNRDVGFLASESDYYMLAVGRLPGAGYTFAHGDISFTDSKNRYGQVIVVSSNGVKLGDPGCAMRVYAWSYSRGEDHQFSAWAVDGSRNAVQTFRTTQVSGLQTGVVMLEKLRIRINVTGSALRAYALDRYASRRTHPSHISGGKLYLHPERPRIFVQ
jgi:hypothetical protein